MRCKNADRSSGLVTHLARGAFDQIAASMTHLTPIQFGDGRPYRPANWQGPFMEIGIDSFADILPDPATGRFPSATDRMADLIGRLKQRKECSIPKGHSVKGRHIDRDDD
jgi:hypothetical protein